MLHGDTRWRSLRPARIAHRGSSAEANLTPPFRASASRQPAALRPASVFDVEEEDVPADDLAAHVAKRKPTDLEPTIDAIETPDARLELVWLPDAIACVKISTTRGRSSEWTVPFVPHCLIASSGWPRYSRSLVVDNVDFAGRRQARPGRVWYSQSGAPRARARRGRDTAGHCRARPPLERPAASAPRCAVARTRAARGCFEIENSDQFGLVRQRDAESGPRMPLCDV